MSMNRFRVLGFVLVAALATAAYAAATPAGPADADAGKTIAMRDDCDPTDPAWNAVGGCALKRGDVTLAEFAAENDSPLALSVIGHQAWRNDPSYLEVKSGATVRVKNAGGRPHTFTEVADFGGGIAPNPALNEGLTTAPECPGSMVIAPGDAAKLEGLEVGSHRFQCCLHPWMRALVDVG
jgi:plastocyanin